MEISSINSQWKSFLRYCAQHAKRGIVTELDCGIAVYWTQVLWAYTNAFFLSNPVTDEGDLLGRLIAINNHVITTQPSFPWVLFLDPELLPPVVRERSNEICFNAGFVRGIDLISMQAMELLPPVHPLPTVEIKFAASHEDLYDAMLLIGEVYNKETSLAKDAIEQHVFISDFNKQFCCIIYVDNKPVSTATTFLMDECLYVTLVATSAQHRKYGYAEVALRTSIQRAQRTSPQMKSGIVLHGSEEARSLYERMGFKAIAHIERYIQLTQKS